ncbi:hypothetical protein TIFTF001_003404 [Ficus carica]|uniref:Uncharacterized protein n=1 Tax=Ficus carica TaxID=3494 RepID=A0AA87Z7S6_FICCA|nr:hypothetical protein TIFTF001_003404 [Ficus carica]
MNKNVIFVYLSESNHIPLQPSRDSGHSDETVQPVAVNNLIIPSPIPPYIPSPTVGLDLHMEDGLEEQYELLNNDFGMNHDDCNGGELNVANAARDSNEKNIAGSIEAQSVVKKTRTQFVHVPVSVNFSGIVVVVDFTLITMSANNIFDNKKIYMMKFGMYFNYLRAWREKETALTSLRGDDAESYKVLPALGEMVKRKNPSSDIHIETDSEKSLKYFYICLAASKQGWLHCCPVIVVDESALKARF